MHTEKEKRARVAILVTDGFEEVELTKPRAALDDAGADTFIVSPKKDTVKAWDEADWGATYDVDVNLSEASPEDYDALLLPGGVLNPDQLRENEDAIRFVKAFFSHGKPVAAICHGPQVLIEAEVVRGRRMTSYITVRKDLENAGAEWADQKVVVDSDLITSRNPDDIPAFNEAIIEQFLQTPQLA